MKNFTARSLNFVAPLARRATAFSLACALVAGSFVASPGASAQQQPQSSASKAARLSEEQRIAHVLGRLGFGARPGDVERVRQMGLERYVEAQLEPEKIADAGVEAKLRNLPSYWMTTAELYKKYPQPGQLLRALQRQGSLPADLAEARDNRKGGDAAAASASKKDAGAKMDADGAMSNEMAKQANGGEAAANEARRDYRQAIQEYYRENNLLQPARITAELQASRILRATYSERQLQEVLVDFWSNHFNVYANKGADRWLLVSYDRDAIRPHTLGKFKDLLLATAQSPAMLFYLDNFQSVSPTAGQNANRPRMRRLFENLTNPQTGGAAGDAGQGTQPRRAARMNRRRELMREESNAQNAQQMPAQQQSQTPAPQQPRRMRRGINENYARELMELHTLGVEGGYTQKDVQEVARCFTGWTIFAPRGGNPMAMPADAAGAPLLERAGTFYFNPRLHDDGEKLVLGHKIPAGGGINDGLAVLDILSKHPATAKFIATKLARRFVSDNPTPALVERVAAAYAKSDGDIRATLRALFASPEFNAPENYRAKIKTPFELAISAVRALGGETTGAPALHQWIARMGEPLYQYQAPTGYPDTAEHWVNTGALLERLNFALALVGNRINGTRVDLARFNGAGGTGADKSRLVEQFAAVILQGDMSERTKAALLKQLNEASATTVVTTTNAASTSNSAMVATGEMNDDDSMMARGGGRRGARREMAANINAPISDAARIAALLLGSPEFQRQ
ncbi:MAG TPA: DUF1800 domain-containing protein [Pyrinomonadaceae bacterium]|jgi:uncharacterized protein (DUF1800 family)|nr:DUF1800 domain-containing protein [Pyrinomonadaceae bacterium]